MLRVIILPRPAVASAPSRVIKSLITPTRLAVKIKKAKTATKINFVYGADARGSMILQRFWDDKGSVTGPLCTQILMFYFF